MTACGLIAQEGRGTVLEDASALQVSGVGAPAKVQPAPPSGPWYRVQSFYSF